MNIEQIMELADDYAAESGGQERGGRQEFTDEARAALEAALREALERWKSTCDALLEVAEQSVDTRRCSVGILRAMNDARSLLAEEQTP